MGLRRGFFAALYCCPIRVFALSLVPTETAAYRLRRASDGRPLVWTVDRISIAVITDRVDDPLGAQQAVQRAVAAWTDAGVDLEIDVRAASPTVLRDAETTRVVRWETVRWPHGSHTLAMTTAAYDEATAALVDSDIIFNGGRCSLGEQQG